MDLAAGAGAKPSRAIPPAQSMLARQPFKQKAPWRIYSFLSR